MSITQRLTQKDFNLLDFENKLQAIYNSGEFIDSHITSVGESNIINFYNFNEFLVEVVYDLVGTKIKAINCLNLKTELEYLEPEVC